MLCGLVGHQYKREMLVPILLVLGGEESQLSQQDAVEPLHHPIRLEPKRGCSGFINLKKHAHRSQELGLKVLAVVSVQLHGHAKSGEEPFPYYTVFPT